MLLLVLTVPAQSSGASVELSVHGTHGYTIEIEGSGREVTLSAEGPFGFVAYEVPGRVTRRGVAANFGRLGTIDVAFRPGARLELATPPRRCEGRPRIKRWGAFVGTVRFRGERGFTRVRVRRATGSLRVNPRWRCGRSSRASGRSPSISRQTAQAAASDDPVSLDLIDRRHQLDEVGAFALGRGSGFSLTAFFAVMRERRGRMQIRRVVFEFGENRDFAYDESLTEATVSPPFPFSGRGTFRREPGGVSWTGSLAVTLPGTARIPLVGPRYRLRLYRNGEDGIAKASGVKGIAKPGI